MDTNKRLAVITTVLSVAAIIVSLLTLAMIIKIDNQGNLSYSYRIVWKQKDTGIKGQSLWFSEDSIKDLDFYEKVRKLNQKDLPLHFEVEKKRIPPDSDEIIIHYKKTKKSSGEG